MNLLLFSGNVFACFRWLFPPSVSSGFSDETMNMVGECLEFGNVYAVVFHLLCQLQLVNNPLEIQHPKFENSRLMLIESVHER